MSSAVTAGRVRCHAVITGRVLRWAAPARDGEFGAVVAFYSIIHLAPGELGPAFWEIRRVPRADPRALVSFHVGPEVRHLEQSWSQAVDIDFRFLQMADVAEGMERAGFSVEARLERASYADHPFRRLAGVA
jgi:hypothetical protein